MAHRTTANGIDASSPDTVDAHGDQELVQEYLDEPDTTYAEVDVSIEHARSSVSRAVAKTIAPALRLASGRPMTR